ncbi:MAG: Ig-like domain-containing protein [Solirubrobacteraceae bacterium]
MRFTTRLVRALPVGSGTYKVLICTDIYSQLQRFAQNTNCSPGARLAISTISLPRPSGPVPKTIIRTGLASVSRSSTAAFRFVSTVGRSTFECSLDDGLWLACSSPQGYTALVEGPHAFAVRAISPSGKEDPTPVHASWTVHTVPPAVTLRSPVRRSTTHNNKPAFSGAGGTAPVDSSTITVKVFSGSNASDSRVQTLTATVSGGKWSVAATQPLADGTYTAEAEQSDSAGNTGVSTPSTFTIGTTPPARVSDLAVGGNATAATPSTYSIGGTVSGLSGTVVLQDNGGNDLSVSSDGPFTFSAPVADGAAYNVTVKNNPSGQTCTTSGAAGTVASANVTSVAVTCTTSTTTPTPGEDDFNRANGGLGAGWVTMSDGGLSIVSQAVVGTAGATAGDIRVGESYGSDQYSRIEVTSTQLSGGEWIGPTVRSQNGGQNTYLGIYFWNNGNPQLRLYKRTSGTWIQLGNSYDSGPLPAGTQLTLSAVGSKISFQQNGTERIAATDTTLTGGAPGLMTYDAATTDNWAGGNATAATPSPLLIQYRSTDSNGVASYNFTSSDDGYGTHVLRVLAPTNPAPGVPHNFLYVLPVEPELGTVYGDGLETLRGLNAQNQYNLTIIEPSFAIDPWYADNPNDPNLHYETFLTNDLVPWVTQNLTPPAASQPFAPLTGNGQNWLIGFSKSGIGGADLLLKHPDLFAVAASWDFPADMATYSQFGSSSANNYGTDANFQANYRLTPTFVDTHKTPFLSKNRIWIGGYYDIFGTDVADYDALLTSEGIAHTTETPQLMPHRWDSGWIPMALSAMSQDGAALAATL